MQCSKTLQKATFSRRQNHFSTTSTSIRNLYITSSVLEMHSEFLLIAICVAAYIDISSVEGINVVDCKSNEDFVNEIENKGLNKGIVPILVTKNVNPEMEQQMIGFYKNSNIKTVLKLCVNSGCCDIVDDYLQPDNKQYPALYMMVNGQLVNGVAVKTEELGKVWLNAFNRDLKHKNYVIGDIRKLIQEQNYSLILTNMAKLSIIDTDELDANYSAGSSDSAGLPSLTRSKRKHSEDDKSKSSSKSEKKRNSGDGGGGGGGSSTLSTPNRNNPPKRKQEVSQKIH